MGELFEAFGLDWRILVINLINFGALLLVLWYFLYGPVVRMLESRREKIAQGVRDAEAAAEELRSIEASRAEMLGKAGKEADEIVGHARAQGTLQEREILARAESSAARVLAEADAQAKDMKAKAIQESKQEVAKLIVLGIEKTMKEKKV